MPCSTITGPGSGQSPDERARIARAREEVGRLDQAGRLIACRFSRRHCERQRHTQAAEPVVGKVRHLLDGVVISDRSTAVGTTMPIRNLLPRSAATLLVAFAHRPGTERGLHAPRVDSLFERIIRRLCLLALACAGAVLAQPGNQPEMKWWYGEPAAKYWEALPLSNGWLAAMVYGRTRS